MADLIKSQPLLVVGLGAIATFMVFALVRERYDRRWLYDGDHTARRLRLYARTMVIHWSLAILCVSSWVLAGHDLESFGFRGLQGWQGWVTAGLTGLGFAQLFYGLIKVGNSRQAREKVRRQIKSAGKLDRVAPTSPEEYRRFRWLALTAGIAEEITFRGFLIGALAMAMPLWIAASLATALFVIAHAYQGVAGLLRVLPFAVLLSFLFVFGGSLWPVMLLHIAADIIGGEMIRLTDRHADADAAVDPP